MCDVSYLKMAELAVGATAQAQNYQRVSTSAHAAEADAQAGLYARVNQDSQAVTDQMVDRSRAAMREVGSLNAIFADTNLSGNSQARIIAASEGAASADLTTLDRNRAMRATQGATESAAISARTQDRINSTPRPSLLGTGLQIAAVEMDRRNRAAGVARGS